MESVLINERYQAPRFHVYFEGDGIHEELYPGKYIQGTLVLFVRMSETPLDVKDIHLTLVKQRTQSRLHDTVSGQSLHSIIHEITSCTQPMRNYNDKSYNMHWHYLPEGYYKLPFFVRIPTTLNWEEINRLTLKAEIISDDRKTDPCISIALGHSVDLNKFLPDVAHPQEMKDIQDIFLESWFDCCFSGESKGEVEFYFKIPRKGYTPGEMIYLSIEIRNYSSVNVLKTKIFICEVINGKHESSFVSFTGVVEKMTVEQFDKGIRVPTAYQLFEESDTIHVKHYLRFEVRMASGSEFLYKMPILIGSIPLKVQS